MLRYININDYINIIPTTEFYRFRYEVFSSIPIYIITLLHMYTTHKLLTNYSSFQDCHLPITPR